jgi:hypothetical protein
MTEDSGVAESIAAAKIRRALLSGPECVTKDATVVEMDAQGNMSPAIPIGPHWMLM